MWGKPAENIANYISKGRLIGVAGRIETRSYEGKDGTKRYVTEVIAEEVKYLDKANSSNSGTEEHREFEYVPMDGDDDIPF